MGAGAFFPGALIPFIVLMTVLLAGAFFAGAGLVTIVVPLLVLLDSLALLALPFAALVGAFGTGAFLPPLPAPVVDAAAGGGPAFLAVPARVVLARSTKLLISPAAPVSFGGDAGRASCDFPSCVARAVCDLGGIWELDDLGEST